MLGIGLEADRHLIGVAAMSNAIFDVTTPDGGGESYVRAHGEDHSQPYPFVLYSSRFPSGIV
jgi:hypothetical protein